MEKYISSQRFPVLLERSNSMKRIQVGTDGRRIRFREQSDGQVDVLVRLVLRAICRQAKEGIVLRK